MTTNEPLSQLLPGIAHVAEETSAREVNKMLCQGWKLLLVLAAHDAAGSYPVYVLGKPSMPAAIISGV